jgi:arylsulfatase A-like enzyme
MRKEGLNGANIPMYGRYLSFISFQMGKSMKHLKMRLTGKAGIGMVTFISLQNVADAITTDRINVVFLLADDLRWNSLGCMGNPVVITPNIDQLATDGIRFDNARVTTAICMVSRASILSGRTMSRHQVTKFGVPLSDQTLGETYAAVLRRSGYWTGFVGKYGVGQIRESDYDFSSVYEGKHWLPVGNGDSIHVTVKNEQDALTFLKVRPKGKPFLLSVSFFATHAEDRHPDQYRYQPQSEKYYMNTVIPVSETATEEALKALPPFIRDEKNEGRNRWHWRYDSSEKYQRYMKAYYRMLTELDSAIGRIVAELKKQGVYENTLIIFMGDNGYFQSDHMLADKWYPYEEAIRVPLIVKDPRLPVRKRNTSNHEFVLNIDIAPTIIGAAGEQIPPRMQGQDFASLYLNREKPVWRKDFYYEHPVVNNISFIPSSEAIITRRDKYIFWPDYKYEEYFNLKKDPFEEQNSITKKKYQVRIRELKERLSELKLKAQ